MKPYRWLASTLLLVAATLSAPRPCHADDAKTQLSAEENEKATKLLAEGNKAFKAGKFAKAEKAYAEAFALKKVHDIAGNLGMAEFAQGKTRDAAEHLAFALRLFPITGEPAQREQMQKTYDQCKGSVGAVRVSVNVKDAQVYVDGNLVGDAPLLDPVFVAPGEHTIETKKPDQYKNASQTVKADKGASLEVTLTMELLPKPKPKQVIVEVPVPAKRRSLVPGIAMAAGALAAAGAGIGLFVESNIKQEDALSQDKALMPGTCYLKPTNPGCVTLDNTARSVDTFRYISVGTFIGAGLLAVGAVTYLLLPTPKPAKKKIPSGLYLHASPVVLGRDGAMMIWGSF